MGTPGETVENAESKGGMGVHMRGSVPMRMLWSVDMEVHMSIAIVRMFMHMNSIL